MQSMYLGRITTQDDDEGLYVDITGTVDDVRQEPVIEIDGRATETILFSML